MLVVRHAVAYLREANPAFLDIRKFVRPSGICGDVLERIRGLGRKAQVLPALCLVGVSLALTGCNEPLQSVGSDVATARRDTSVNPGRGITRASNRRVPEAKAHGIEILSAGHTTDEFVRTHAPGAIRDTDTLDFTDEQLQKIQNVLVAMRPLLRCHVQPPRFLVHVDELGFGLGGLQSDKPVAIFIAQSNGGSTFASTLVHELAHALLQSYDPTTCNDHQRYNGANPIVEKWKRRFQWYDDGPFVGERPVDPYGHKNAAEDMATAFEAYFFDRSSLKDASPGRRKFFDDLFIKLIGYVPSELGEDGKPRLSLKGHLRQLAPKAR
ncbi:MAG: hypothetical protein H7Z43_01575 [Clostridia bacterium]|nr:hypothetical protein [Deltaproteobacteria bacterium]